MRRSYLLGNVSLVSFCLSMMTAQAAENITVSKAATKNMTFSGGVFAPAGDDAVLNAADLENALAAGTVTVSTGNTGTQTGDITVAAPIGWTSNSGLTLDAHHSITVTKPVSDSGAGALTLTTNDNGTGGTLSFIAKGKVTFLATSNVLTINGQVYALEKSLPALAGAISANASGNYALSKSYDAKADGTYSAAPIASTFAGNFNGLGNKISNLTISNQTKRALLGLFAIIGSGGTVSSVNIAKVNISGGNSPEAGALAAQNVGLVFNDHADGLIDGEGSKGETVVGGLVAVNSGTVSTSGAAVDTNVQGGGSLAGGLVGVTSPSSVIESSYAFGDVAVRGKGAGAGGLVGSSPGVIMNSYARGGINGSSTSGGLAGGVDTGTVISSYSTGSVKGGVSVGGFAGASWESTITTSYWDTQTSGQDEGTGDGNVSGLTGLTTKQFKSGLPAGFDPAVWAQSPKINDGYPYLIANPPVK